MALAQEEVADILIYTLDSLSSQSARCVVGNQVNDLFHRSGLHDLALSDLDCIALPQSNNL